MGEHGGWVRPGGLLPNGLLSNQGSTVSRPLDSASWMKAEERTAELITCIQPNQPSEERRNAVADYVQRLIIKCFPCQVFTFGSVPLKTYLPDGDIDLTAFSNNQSLKDTWANKVRDMLEEEEKNESAEFNVKEVQYIQAEVKIIKCLVENIVVDISFNQLGGLCTLCFLEEVDHLINQNHLFKRSIILIKAWCYYESRILGAHHGLISTYALETLVLYIFHIFNSSFTGPLEVLYRFLEFFSNFDWDNFCISLLGPVPISSLPDLSAEPPRKDGGELLLSKLFLDACSSVYAVFPSGQDNHGQPFVSKHFNVIDPLRINNNLGRSVSKGNFFRIRSAFAFGAEKLGKVVECSKEKCVSEVNHFFNNTWDRHGNGRRSDTRIFRMRPPNLPKSPALYQQQPLDPDPGTSNLTHDSDFPALTTSRTDTSMQKIRGPKNSKLYNSETISQTSSSILRSENPTNDFQRRTIFARTRSSPELSDARSRGRPNRAMVCGNGYALSAPRNARKKFQDQETGDHVDPGRVNLHRTEDVCADSGSTSQEYYGDQDSQSVVQQRQQEDQDPVNLLGSSSLSAHKYNGLVQVPLRFPVSPSVLSPAGYPQRPAMVSANIPLIDPSWTSSAHFSQGLMHSSPLAHYFPAVDMSPNRRNFRERGNEAFCSGENSSIDGDRDFWHEMDMAGDNGSLEMPQVEDKQQSCIQAGGSAGFYTEQWDSAKDDHSDPYEYKEDRAGDASFEYRTSTPSAMSSRSEAESSWEGPPPPRAKKPGRKTEYNIGKGVLENNMPFYERDTPLYERGRGRNRSPGLGSAEASTSDPVIPITPIMVGPGFRQREAEDSGVLPFAFYPTGPPVPFLTMLPVYNFPDGSHLCGGNGAENGDGDGSESGEMEAMGMGFSRMNTCVGPPDILTSDFTSHWQNLQYGRFCQNPRLHRPVVYPPPVVVPPMYLQGHFPWDGPGRPVSPGNVNFFAQVMGYGPPRFVPVAPNRPSGGGSYQRFLDEVPRYRSGTGTYLPNPKVSGRDRHGSGSRRTTSYNQERSGEQHGGEREGNWSHSKSRAGSGRNHGRVQAEKQQQQVVGRSYKHDPLPPYHHYSHNPQLHQNPTASSMAHAAVYSGSGGVAPSQNGAPLQSLVMFYPYDHSSSTYTFPEFASFAQSSDSQQQQQQQQEGGDEDRLALSAYYEERGSPDQPSSPHKHW